MRVLSLSDLSSLKTKAKNGDRIAQWQLAMCILYGQSDSSKGESLFAYLTSHSASPDENALLLMGYACEHAIGTPKDYASAIDYYSRAYDQHYNIKSSGKASEIDGTKAMKELESRYDKLVKKISQIVALKDFCQYKDGRFLFPWTNTTRKSLEGTLPQLSKDIAEFSELFTKAITDLKDENHGRWEFLYQDTLLMPVEVIKALSARDQLEQYFRKNGHQVFPADVYFNNAVGRCLIDDDEAHDNDYIIGGLLNMAGHEDNALWQYRVGLWYEYCDNDIEPMTASYWYDQAKKEIPAATTALERVHGGLNYKIITNAKEGTVKDCQALTTRSSKNPQNSIGWIIESALRGDESAIQRLENNQLSPKGQSSIFVTQSSADDTQPYYTLLKEEADADKRAAQQWEKLMQAEKAEYRKRIEEEERRKAEEERRRIEAERKAKAEAIRKAKETEEAKRRAEQEKKDYAARCENLITDIKKIANKYNDLTDKWEKEGLPKYNLLPTELKESEDKFEELIMSATLKWWQIPFYKRGTWNIRELLSYEKKEGKEKLGKLSKKKKEIEDTSIILERNLDVKGEENNAELLEKRLKESTETFKKYNKYVNEAFKSIDAVNIHIARLMDESAKQLVKPEFSWERSLFNIFTTCVVVSIVLVLFDMPYGHRYLLLSCCCLGICKVSKTSGFSLIGIIKGIFLGVMGGLFLKFILWIILSLFGGGSSSSDSDNDEVSDSIAIFSSISEESVKETETADKQTPDSIDATEDMIGGASDLDEMLKAQKEAAEEMRKAQEHAMKEMREAQKQAMEEMRKAMGQ